MKRSINLFVLVITLTILLSSCTATKPNSTTPFKTQEMTAIPTTLDQSTQTYTPTGTDTTPIKTVETDRGVVTLTFVSINDLHGYILQDDYGYNGLSNTSYLIDTMSQYFADSDPMTTTRDDIVLFANGDMFQGTAISNKGYGAAVLNAMNVMGFDGMGIGNHEFDWGLDTILSYWDSDEGNGEAKFPLVASNVAYKNNGVLVSDADANDNCVAYTIVEKEGVKVGIISCIGPCENSILQTNVKDYRFDDVTQSVKKAATELEKAGAELISVNIHYGTTRDVNDYSVNREIANLKNDSGEYLIDVIFNGHTHYKQSGVVTRTGAASVPVIQAGANNEAVGYITLSYDTSDGSVTYGNYGYKKVSDVGKNYDKDVEKVIQDYYKTYIDDMKVLAVSDVSISSKYAFTDYTADIMIKATGADYSASNNGGLRGTGDIKAGSNITEETVYSIIPFDNEVYFVTIQGKALYDFYGKEQSYCYFGKSSSAPEWENLKDDSNYYTLAIIDYVYSGNYFKGSVADYTPYMKSEINTGLVLRDLLVKDISINGEKGIRWSPFKTVQIGKQEFKAS